MKFDFCIGNPPYMESTESESTRMPPVYNLFMDAAFQVSNKVELITPARFLFNAGFTPKAWNEKMLLDSHFKVMEYEPDASKVFSNTDIKGGIAITYRDRARTFGAIEIFTKYPELNAILQKVRLQETHWVEEIVASPLSFQLSPAGVAKMKKLHPETYCNPDDPKEPRLRSSAFTSLKDICFINQPTDGHKYIRLYGLYETKRTERYIRQDYVRDISETLEHYTVLMPKASGIGQFGEPTGPTYIAEPGLGFTQTFIGIGRVSTKQEAKNIQIYVKTKFARAMLGILKITQDCPGPKWKYVPLQNFTAISDIDWSVPVAAIDKQLYRKYGLTKEEIAFIETNVKEMV